ncbi:MAG TPA: glycosyltransferase family 1 protein [Burkholderiaceae bacterium]|nr:glycosyltransferase family 1 protein [Burkholderiaceae bacterium]
MKILTVTDAWHPQVNGVVRTIEATNRELARAGHEVHVISPQSFFTVACPGYGEIRLSVLPYRRLARMVRAIAPDAVHIATEGPLGLAARRYCVSRRMAFTTAYHTRFPQYLKAMYGIPEVWVYRFLRWFHRPAHCMLTPTAHIERELAQWGIGNFARWTRGVDLDVFHPVAESSPFVQGSPHPIFLFVGRVSVEKNIDAFLNLDLPGTKLVAGIGPELQLLRERHPEVRFLGILSREELAQLYSSVDVFVFPSRTDTFGLVLLEALACGTPVAAYPVQGPLDVVGGSGVAVLDEDLRKAALAALRIDRHTCRAYAERFSWAAATQQFLERQSPCSTPPPAAPRRVAAQVTEDRASSAGPAPQ